MTNKRKMKRFAMANKVETYSREQYFRAVIGRTLLAAMVEKTFPKKWFR